MTQITKKIRNDVRKILIDSDMYDASSMTIGRNGMVTAIKDANKTYAGNDATRYFVGYFDELIAREDCTS